MKTLTSWKRSRSSSAFSSPRSFGISTDSATSSGTSIASSTWRASESCGITSARTKLVTSSRRRPVRASSSIRRTLSAVAITSGSFWKPSRGPTSRMRTCWTEVLTAAQSRSAQHSITSSRSAAQASDVRAAPANPTRPVGSAPHDRLRHRHRRLGRTGLRARAAPRHRGHPDRRRLARCRPGRGDRRQAGRGGAGGGLRGVRERGGRGAIAGRVRVRAVPQPVREADEPQGAPARGPVGGRRDRPAGRRGVRPRYAPARRVAGLGRPADGGDGPRGGARRVGPAHGGRGGPARPRADAGRGHPRVRRQEGRQARGGGDRRAHPRPALRRLRAARAVADHGVADRAADRGQRALQDARGHPADRAPGRAVGAPVVVLAGGTGGAKLARGLLDEVGEDLVVVANTGDDVEIYGAHVSPDPDLVMFWLADRIDERGWGLRDDTFRVMDGLRELGEEVWFNLGDRDLALCLRRARRLTEGARLTEVLDETRLAMGVPARVLPATDDPVRTHVRADGRWWPLQDFLIRHGGRGPVEAVEFRGA